MGGARRTPPNGEKGPSMPLAVLLIIIGIALAILVNYILGIIVILIGLALLLVPTLSSRRV